LFVSAQAQNSDNDFQKLYSRAKLLLSKSPDLINKDDISLLKELIELDPNQFGEENVRLCKNLTEQAKKKKIEYDEYLERMRKMSATLDKLDDEAHRRKEAEHARDELAEENKILEQVISNLKSALANSDNQIKKMKNANEKLQKENLASKELLQASSSIVGQMLDFMRKTNVDSNTYSKLPQNLVDSLEFIQCELAKSLKDNFSTTITQLRHNKLFMDTAAIYYKNNKEHSSEIKDYMVNSNELVKQLRGSGINCAMDYASDIENEMNEFIIAIESGQEEGSALVQFILGNIAWIAPVCLILLILIVVLVRKTSKK
jgi:myosin heavy subunit